MPQQPITGSELDYILTHFQEPLFPRKIMTKELGCQIEIFDKDSALNYFRLSNYQDCRINAYPPFTDFYGINRTPISFLVMDLDLKDFGNSKARLDKALKKTLKKIKESIGGIPTVLWTGNGIHIYQPVSGVILEEYETFHEFTKYLDKDLTSLFIQFAEEYFTESTADHLHNPTVKSCLLRIPGSLNSKCIAEKKDPEIKIIQKWDGKRPSIQPLLLDFRRSLIQKRIDDIEELKKQEKKKHSKYQIMVSQDQHKNPINKIKWIEKGILENPLSDHRKYIVWRILSPYLLNVKNLPKEESYSVIKEWLDKCHKLERLTFNSKSKIREGLRGANKGYYPISLDSLKSENKELYDVVVSKLE
jgi:hypothetical protein